MPRKLWFNCDPCGIVCGFITHLFILFADFSICYGIIWPWRTVYSYFYIFLYQCLAGMAISSHLASMLNDPGCIPKPSHENLNDLVEQGIKKCSKCMAPKPPRAHHCSVCNRCILKMDHHCPWINNCVGIYNQKHFLLFLLYINLTCGYTILILVWRTATCVKNFPDNIVDDDIESQCNWSPTVTICAVFAAILAVIFGLFTIVMFIDQLSGIISNTTGIEFLQNNRGCSRSTYESLIEVFGCSFSWNWFVPTQVRKMSLKKTLSDIDLSCIHEEDVKQNHEKDATPSTAVCVAQFRRNNSLLDTNCTTGSSNNTAFLVNNSSENTLSIPMNNGCSDDILMEKSSINTTSSAFTFWVSGNNQEDQQENYTKSDDVQQENETKHILHSYVQQYNLQDQSVQKLLPSSQQNSHVQFSSETNFLFNHRFLCTQETSRVFQESDFHYRLKCKNSINKLPSQHYIPIMRKF